MPDNNTYFDDFLKSQLESQKIDKNKATKAAFLKKAARYRFWHFFPLSFNIYYLLGIVVVLIAGSVYFSSIISNKTEKYNPEPTHRIFDINITLPSPNVHNRETLTKKTNQQQEYPQQAINTDNHHEKSRPDSKKRETNQHDAMLDTLNTHNPQHKSINQFEPSQKNDDLNAEEKGNIEQSVTGQEDTLPIVDTIFRKKHIQHTDTVTKEIKKTIEIKKEQKKRRHR